MPYKNLNIIPFNTDYDPEKKYRFVLFRSGLPLQNRELTELQLALYNYAKQSWDTIYKNGSIIEGCDIFLDKKNKKIYINDGKLYYDGAVHIFKPSKQGINYTGSGIEKFGLKVKEEIISPLQSGFDGVDNSLLDNANGSENYGNPGACRLKVDFEFSKIEENDNNFYIELVELENGEIKKLYTNKNYSDLGDYFASRTYDESGHYIVNGLNLYTEKNIDNNKITVSVSPGKAYVKGYEVNLISPVSLEVEKANDVNDVNFIDNEIINNIQINNFYGTYIVTQDGTHNEITQGCSIKLSDGTNDIFTATVIYKENENGNDKYFLAEIEFFDSYNINDFNNVTTINGYKYTNKNSTFNDTTINIGVKHLIDKYQLKEPYLKNIEDIDIDIVETSDIYTINSTENYISLPTNASKVILCKNVDDGTIYKEGTHYTVSNGVIVFNNITDTIQVVTIYIISITPELNNEFFTDSEDNEVFNLYFYSNINGENNIKNKILGFADFHIKKSNGEIIDDSSIEIQYYTYKARTDVFGLSKDGKLIRIKGVNTYYTDLIVPNIPTDFLPLGYIKFMPNLDYDKCIINEYRIIRLTMNKLNKLYKKLNRLEENQATLALESHLKEGNLVTNLRGILVDSLENFLKMDYLNPDFNVSINLINNEMLLPIENNIFSLYNTDEKKLNINVSNIKTFNYDLEEIKNKCITKNTLSNDVILLENNKFSNSRNLNPFGAISVLNVTIFPNKDNWIENEIVDNPIYDYQKPHPFLLFQNNIYKENTIEKAPLLTSYIKINHANPVKMPININNRNLIIEENDKLHKISEQIITFIRSKKITFKITNFSNGIDETNVDKVIKIYFENDPIIPDEITINGNIITGSFTIPPNRYHTGTKKIKFMEVFEDGTAGKQCEVLYYASGIKEIYEKQTIIHEKPFTPTLPITHSPLNLCTKWEEVDLGPVSSVPNYYGLFYEKKEINGEQHYVTKKCVEHRASANDPLAQSFRFEKDIIISGFEVIFTKIPEGENPKDVFMNIGYLNNGYPDSNTIFYTQFITRDEIKNNSTILNIDNNIYYSYKINFKQPIYIEANKDFFISLGSEDTDYEIAISELGKTDKISGEVIYQNAYLVGVLFSSSNNLTWTAEQSRDMCFKLYTYEFDIQNNSEILITVFKNKNENDLDLPFSFLTNVDFNLPQNCNLNAYYSTELDNSNTNFINFKPFKLNKEIHFKENEFPVQNFAVKLILQSSDKNLSPIIDYDDLTQLIMFNYKSDENENFTGCYITKEIENCPEYNKIKIILDVYQKYGSISENSFYIKSFEIKPSENSDYIIYNTNSLNDIEEEMIGNGWKKITYNLNLPTGAVTYFKLKMNLISGKSYLSPIIQNIRIILHEE